MAVKIDAFPFTRYGLVHGTLREVGRDAAQACPPGRDGAGHDGASGPDAPSGSAPDAATYPAKVLTRHPFCSS